MAAPAAFGSTENGNMKTRSLRTLAAACLAAVAAGACAAPEGGTDEAPVLQRNGAVSRHFWSPGFASGEWGGSRFSAGLAVGLRGPVRDNLGRGVAPALSWQLEGRARLSLLARGDRGVMLVWHRGD